KKSAQIREILINESAWEEMTCLFAPSLTSPVRKLRNRIAHHEPILNRNLEDDFATIKRIIAYRCQHSLEWMLKNQVLLPLLTLKPL
ncbi:TPA: hypothetical protein ACNE3A_004842, partial [Escherichia coli]